MKIERIFMHNFKRPGDLSVELGAMNIIHGPNGSGKSTISDAVRFVIGERLPELADTNRAQFELASGDQDTMIVMAEAEKSSKKVVYERSGEKISKKVSAGKEWGNVPQVMISAREYFDRSPTERVRYLFKFVDDIGSCEAICDEIEKGLALKLSKEELEKTADLREEIRGMIVPMSGGGAVQDWLESVTEIVRKKANDLRAEYQIMDKMIKGTIALAEDARPKVDTDRISKEIEELSKTIENLKERLRRQPEIKKEIEEVTKKIAARVDAQKLIREKELALKKLAGTINSTEDAVKMHRHLDKLKRTADALEDEASDIQAAIRQRSEMLKEYEQAKCCPICEAAGTKWQAKLIKRLKKEIADLKVSLEKNNKAAAEIREELDNGTRELEKQVERAETEKLLEWLRNIQGSATKLDEELELLTNQVESEILLRKKIAEAESAKRERAEIIRGELMIVGERSRIEQAQARFDELKHEYRAVEALKEEIVRQQEAIIRRVVGEIIGRANAICTSVPLLRSGLEYQDGAIGFRRNGKLITTTMSGAEQAIAYSAFCLALAVRSPMRILVIDEMGKLDDETAIAFVKAVEKQIEAGQIDQFIGVDQNRERYKVASAIRLIDSKTGSIG